jgi:hypothetical protein
VKDLHLKNVLSILSDQTKNPVIMKKRISRILNFFAFNLLFFALYLNFIHKDSNSQAAPAPKTATAVSKGTVLVSNPEQYLNKGQVKTDAATAQLQN